MTTKGASGDVEIRSIGGPGNVNTVSGDVRIGTADEAIAVTTVSGDVRVAARPGLALWIDAQSVSGTMQSDLDVDNVSGPAAGEAPVELRIRTVSGDVRITRSVSPVR